MSGRYDYIDALRKDPALLEQVERIPEPANGKTAKPEPMGTDVARQPSWPDPLAPEAFYSLAGDIVRAVEPHSEADPVALLIQALAIFGNMIGRGPYFVAEADRHYANLFAVLVGISSKGRKGSSFSRIIRLIRLVDAEHRQNHGLSSGEGLIWAVRDAVEKREPIKEKGRIVDYQVVVADEGVEDKRLLVFESEFAGVLKQAREGGKHP